MAGDPGEACRAFDAAHRRHYEGLPYLCQFGRDTRAVQPALRVYGLPLVLEMIEAYWQERELAEGAPNEIRYAAGRSTPSVPAFVAQIPNLIARYRFTAKPPAGVDLPEEMPGALRQRTIPFKRR